MPFFVTRGGLSDHGQLVGLGDDDHAAHSVSAVGTYSGNSSVNRAIAHGLGRIPQFVLFAIHGNATLIRMVEAGIIEVTSDNVPVEYAVTSPTTTNFYIGNATNYGGSANMSGMAYDWVALG